MCLDKAAKGTGRAQARRARIVEMRGVNVRPPLVMRARVCSSPAGSVCLPINGPATV
jgi:hypothetical protein